MSAILGGSDLMKEREHIRRTRTRQELRELGFTPRGILLPAAAVVAVILAAAVIAWAISRML